MLYNMTSGMTYLTTIELSSKQNLGGVDNPLLLPVAALSGLHALQLPLPKHVQSRHNVLMFLYPAPTLPMLLPLLQSYPRWAMMGMLEGVANMCKHGPSKRVWAYLWGVLHIITASLEELLQELLQGQCVRKVMIGSSCKACAWLFSRSINWCQPCMVTY